MSPIARYFKGHGEDVKRSIENAHPNYSRERVNSEFYATANKTGMKPGSPQNKPKRKSIGQRVAEGA